MKRNDVIEGAPESPAAIQPSPSGAKRILIPLDLLRGTIDPLLFVQRIAAETPVRVTLLHVVSLNVGAVGKRVYEELCSEAQAGLLKLARLFFGEEQETRVSIRIGRPHEQIIEEARSEGSNLIILSAGKPGSWARLLALGTAERVVRSAPCPSLILPRAAAPKDGPACVIAARTAQVLRPQAAPSWVAGPSNRFHSAFGSQ